MAQRVTFYIDGFNFYCGLRRTKCNEPQWGDYYWIDMVKLCEGFLGEGQQFEKVIYFTASPLNPEKSSRQSAFLNANKLLNGERFEVVRGKYLDKQIQCHICHHIYLICNQTCPIYHPIYRHICHSITKSITSQPIVPQPFKL